MLFFPRASSLKDIYRSPACNQKSNLYGSGVLGPPHLFSTLDGEEHRVLRKALANAPWTLGQLKRSWEAAFDGRVDLFIRKMHEHAQAQNRVCLSEDRKSTRLNSSHMSISYAVFCLKKKKSERKRVHTSDTT